MRFRRILLAVGAAALLAGCSSGGTGAPTTTAAPTTTGAHSAPQSTISMSQASANYLAAVEDVNLTLGTFVSAAHSWNNSTSVSQAVSDAQPAITSLQGLSATLTNDPWPASSTADVHTLVGDIGTFVGDLQSISQASVLNASTIAVNIQRDESSLATAVGLVRHDLGLPPATPAG
jgi:hypothetical protein